MSLLNLSGNVSNPENHVQLSSSLNKIQKEEATKLMLDGGFFRLFKWVKYFKGIFYKSLFKLSMIISY